MANGRYVLIKGRGGLGNQVLGAVGGFLYSELTNRRPIVDWTEHPYGHGEDDRSNLFHRLFDSPAAEAILLSCPRRSRSGLALVWVGRLDWRVRDIVKVLDAPPGAAAWRASCADPTRGRPAARCIGGLVIRADGRVDAPDHGPKDEPAPAPTFSSGRSFDAICEPRGGSRLRSPPSRRPHLTEPAMACTSRIQRSADPRKGLNRAQGLIKKTTQLDITPGRRASFIAKPTFRQRGPASHFARRWRRVVAPVV